MAPTKFAVVGTGWRSEFFVKLAVHLEEVEFVGSIIRSPKEMLHPTFLSIQECLSKTRPDFLVTAVPWGASPGLIIEAVELGIPVIAETPPAPDLPSLQSLWQRVGSQNLVQVSEQYPLLPSHAARISLVNSQTIGKVSQVHISSTHDYHAIALMRKYLGVGRHPVTIRSHEMTGPLIDPISRAGWNSDLSPKKAATILSLIDFGQEAFGVYDFTDNQWHNQLRTRRTLVRGSHGEINDDAVTHFVAPNTFRTSPILRRQTGYDLDLDGYRTDHIAFESEILYRNPFTNQAWSDEEIAIATLMISMSDWVQDSGPAPYPLADGIHDHHISLAIHRALVENCSVITEPQSWEN